MSGYDDLERQLRESVRERAVVDPSAARTARPSRRGRWLVFVALPLVLVSGVAGATRLADHRTTGERGRDLLGQAGKAMRHEPACRTYRGGQLAPVIDAIPSRGILATLPQLATPSATPIPAGAVDLARHAAGGAVLGRSIRFMSRGGMRVLTFVSRGGWAGGLVDPAACGAAIRAALRRAQSASDPAAYAKAWATLRTWRTFRKTGESFHAMAIVGPGWGGLGGGDTLLPGHALRTGVWAKTDVPGIDRRRFRYAAVALPEAETVRVRSHGRLVATARVRDGWCFFTLPRRYGALTLEQRGADGGVVRRDRAG